MAKAADYEKMEGRGLRLRPFSMSYQQLDKIADLYTPLFALALLIGAFWIKKGAAFPFILRSVLAFVVVQQLSKYLQKKEVFGNDWPSTHFAVALALAVCLIALKRHLWPYAVAAVTGYGALMLYIHSLNPSQYHTPFEMAGSLFAIPLAALFHWKPRQARVRTN